MNNKTNEVQLIVAIWMITFNHENFIEQAVESVMMQKTNFKYKLFIGEDFSTDKTREICIGLKEKYPNKIELLLQSENIGGYKNAQDLYKKCYESGAKYIAMCEGDDYWTDPLKLQKQVDFLEENLEFVVSYHNAMVIDEKGEIINKSKLSPSFQTDYTSSELKCGGNLLTLAVLFRNVKWYKNLFNKTDRVVNGDTFLFTILGEYGHAKYDGSIKPAVYRSHFGGVWSGLNAIDKFLASSYTFHELSKYFSDKGDLQPLKCLQVKEENYLVRSINNCLAQGLYERASDILHSEKSTLLDYDLEKEKISIFRKNDFAFIIAVIFKFKILRNMTNKELMKSIYTKLFNF